MTSNDKSTYRDIYPNLFFDKIIEMGLCVKGQNVLDLGTGTGVLPAGSYKYKAEFSSGDITENQIEWARRLSENAKMNIDYIVNFSEGINFPDKDFDVITACRFCMCLDESFAPPRIHGILKDGGHFCALFMSWLSGESEIARKSEKLVLKFNPAWTGAKRSMPVTPVWAEGLFELENSETFDLDINFTRDSWHRHIKTYCCLSGCASSLSDSQTAEFDKEHIEYLKTVPETFDIPNFAMILNLRKK
ncbi:MAG: class I SAM-dependent methyltransferase [Treponema sp.]|jgi:SAM-dependent methyltransferase|nr:class I SAM-dependent methyltransferase [Treponema sp.]